MFIAAPDESAAVGRASGCYAAIAGVQTDATEWPVPARNGR